MHRKSVLLILHLLTSDDAEREDLEKTSRTVKQLEIYKLELESSLKVTKRSTKKAEQDILDLELEKKRQDFRIDDMMDNLRRLQEKKDLIQRQIKTQQRDTRTLNEMTMDVGTEIDVLFYSSIFNGQVVQFEKKQLMQQWKSSLINLEKREETLKSVEHGIKYYLFLINSQLKQRYHLEYRCSNQRIQVLPPRCCRTNRFPEYYNW
jgi:ribosomal 50S subunit-recycling heat shock protein